MTLGQQEILPFVPYMRTHGTRRWLALDSGVFLRSTVCLANFREAALNNTLPHGYMADEIQNSPPVGGCV